LRSSPDQCGDSLTNGCSFLGFHFAGFSDTPHLAPETALAAKGAVPVEGVGVFVTQIVARADLKVPTKSRTESGRLPEVSLNGPGKAIRDFRDL
jgi:hypothetical protein